MVNSISTILRIQYEKNNHDSVAVDEDIAQHPDTPADILEELTEQVVRKPNGQFNGFTLLNNPNLPLNCKVKLFVKGPSYFRIRMFSLSKYEEFTEEVVDSLIASEDKMTRLSVTELKNFTQKQCEKLLQDKSPRVSSTFVKHPFVRVNIDSLLPTLIQALLTTDEEYNETASRCKELLTEPFAQKTIFRYFENDINLEDLIGIAGLPQKAVSLDNGRTSASPFQAIRNVFSRACVISPAQKVLFGNRSDEFNEYCKQNFNMDIHILPEDFVLKALNWENLIHLSKDFR